MQMKLVLESLDSAIKQFKTNPLGTRVLIQVNGQKLQKDVRSLLQEKIISFGYLLVSVNLTSKISVQKQLEDLISRQPANRRIVLEFENIQPLFSEFASEKEASEFLDRHIQVFFIFQQSFVFYLPTYLYDVIYRHAPNFLKFCSEKIKIQPTDELPLAATFISDSPSTTKILDHKIAILEKQLAEARKLNKASFEIINILESLSGLYFEKKDFEKSFEAYHECTQSSVTNIFNIGFYRHQMGIILLIWSRFDKALETFEESINIRMTLNDKTGLSQTYLEIGNLKFMMGDHQSAFKFYEMAYQIAVEMEDNNLLALSGLNIGVILFHQGQTSGSFERFKAAIDIFRKLDDSSGLALGMAHLAKLQFVLNKNELALKYFLVGRHLAEIRNLTQLVSVIDVNLHIIQHNVGDDEFINLKEKIRQSIATKDRDDQSSK